MMLTNGVLTSRLHRVQTGLTLRSLICQFVAVFCCAMTTIVFNACSSETLVNPPLTDTTPPMNAVMDCTLQISEESLESFDFFVKYYDKDGKVQNEKVIWEASKEDDVKLINKPFKQWKKEVTTTLPATLGLFLEVKPKDDIDLSNPEKKHSYYVGYSVNFKSVRESGKDYVNRSEPYGHGAEMKSGQVEAYFSQGFGKLANFIYTFDKKGEVTAINEWE